MLNVIVAAVVSEEIVCPAPPVAAAQLPVLNIIFEVLLIQPVPVNDIDVYTALPIVVADNVELKVQATLFVTDCAPNEDIS